MYISRAAERSQAHIGFNGAAPARARNAAMVAEHWHRAGSFNGAAPARARNVVSRCSRIWREVIASTGPRPRGRGMCVPTVLPDLSTRASTGPRPRGRGMQPTQSRLCFNGAAPARARNAKSRRLLAWLQRGRARAGAECARYAAASVVLCDASTGPRPRGRGMCAATSVQQRAAIAASTGPRPRGRGMIIAELNDALKNGLSFNGAAPARARN